jgi:putative FmdB family regulatory protein
MPIYEFVCENCGGLVERLQKLTDPPPDACPECGGKMAKIMSRNSFQLKGGGWYRDLYSSSNAKKSGDASPGDSAAAPASTGGSADKSASPATSAPSAPSAPSSPASTGAKPDAPKKKAAAKKKAD